MKSFILNTILVLGFLLTGVLTVGAQEGLKVLSSTYQNGFPDQITFRLEAEGSAEIHEVNLVYTIKGGKAFASTPPTFTPGRHIKAEYVLRTNFVAETTGSYIPPGTEFTFYWVLSDRSGGRLESGKTTFIYTDPRFPWKSLERAGITLWWYAGTESFAAELLAVATQGLERLSQQLGPKYERPMQIYVYRNKTEMQPALPRKGETYERIIETLGTVVSPEIMLLLGSDPNVKQTLAHELSHMVVEQLTDNPYSSIPRWLDEGLAMNAEGELPPKYVRILADAVRGDKLLSVASLSSHPGDPWQVDLFYAEAHSLVKFLVDTFGKEKLLELLQVFRQGSRVDTALKKVYGFDVNGLEQRWRSAIGAKGPALGKQTPEGRPQEVPTLRPLGEVAPSQPVVPSRSLAIALGGAGLALVLVVGLLAWWAFRRRGT